MNIAYWIRTERFTEPNGTEPLKKNRSGYSSLVLCMLKYAIHIEQVFTHCSCILVPLLHATMDKEKNTVLTRI